MADSSSTAQWVPDELVKSCPGCLSKFHMFNRKHHCRACGKVYCGRCSERKLPLANHSEPVRVCDSCFESVSQRKVNNSDKSLSEGSRILYETRSICPLCAVVERRGFKFAGTLAYVVQHRGAVLLYSQCLAHPIPQITLICSAAHFFHRMMTWLPDSDYGASFIDQLLLAPSSATHTSSADVYSLPSSLLSVPTTILAPALPPLPSPLPGPAPALALDSKAVYRRIVAPPPLALPVFAELHLWADGALLTLAQAQQQLARLDALYPPGAHYLLRLHAGLVPAQHIQPLNELVVALEAWVNGAARRDELELSASASAGLGAEDEEQLAPEEQLARAQARAYRALVLVDVSFERLADLAGLPASAFTCPRVFPLLRYFLAPGQQDVCVAELTQSLDALRQFPELSVAVNILVDEVPALAPVVALLLARFAQVRFLVFTHQRAPAAAVDAAVARYRAVFSTLQLQQQRAEQAADAPEEPPAAVPPADLPPIPPASPALRAHPHDVLVALQAWLRSPYYSQSPAAHSVDPLPLLSALASASHGLLALEHWVPLAAARVLGPVLRKLGMGAFAASPDPFAGMASVLVHAGAFPAHPGYTSVGRASAVNLNAVFDVQRVAQASLPIAKQLESGSRLGLFNAARLRSTVGEAARADSPIALGDLFSLTASAQEQQRRMKHVQVVVAVNAGDIVSLDMLRRARPLSVTLNPDAHSPVTHVAADNGCI